jgi:hypothetical protein
VKRSPASWLLAPMHLAALATGAKSFRDNPIIGSPGLNRLGLHVSRMRLAAAMTARRRAHLSGLVSAQDAADFDRDGFVMKRDFLPAAAFEALRHEALTLEAPARGMLQGDALTRRIALDSAAVRHLPHLRQLLESPQWLGLLRYVGASRMVPLTYIQTIFSGVRAAPPDPQTRLHADTFHSSVKAWLFLTDVAEDEGAFCYVPGSHRLTPERLAWEQAMSIEARDHAVFQAARGSPRIEPDDLGRLNYPPPRLFGVPANTLVVADTLGFHARGPSVRPTARAEIWAYGRRNPFLPWTGMDPLSIPHLRDRPVEHAWRALDLAEQIGMKRNTWRKEGMIRALDPPRLERLG